ncbi:MAG: hypothetical protein ACAH83_08725 [Alphaproteobacteria bacterium]
MAKKMTQKKLTVGEMVEGEGIFVGTWEPEARGVSLRKKFNVFAAPADLNDDAGNRAGWTYQGARDRIAGLKNWHGHDGSKHANEAALIKAMDDGKYKGGWVIPPSAVLSSMICDQRDKGQLKDTFAKTTYEPPYTRADYWSSSEQRFQGEAMVWAALINLPQVGTLHGKGNQNFCRPVRFAEIRKK